jgi:enterochelin esterase-like enzyme
LPASAWSKPGRPAARPGKASSRGRPAAKAWSTSLPATRPRGAHLAVAADAAGRTLAGYSAGGFGAVDIGLRHRSTFGTLEAWSGYFEPPHDGPFRHASTTKLEDHDPTSLVRRNAADLRRAPVRLYLSVGSTHDRWTERRTLAFAHELRALRLPFRLWLAPGGHNGRFWRRQLPSALEFAVPGRLQEV